MTTSLKVIRSQLELFKPVATVQQEFKALLEVHINAEPQRPNAKTNKDLREDLSVDLHYSEENIKGGVVLFLLLRDYLVLKGFKYVPDPENNKIMFGLIKCFLSDEDKNPARRMLQNSKYPDIAQSSSTASGSAHRINNNEEQKIAHN